MNDLKVLLVEDDEKTSLLLEKFLKKYFEHIEVAYNGEEAFQKYLSFMPNIVLTDINMPKLNGINFVKKIREVDTKTHIIILTAYNIQENLSEVVKLDLDDLLLKPIDLTKLKETLDMVLCKYEKNHLLLTDGFYWCFKDKLLFDKNSSKVELSKNEKKLFSLLCKNKDIHFSKYDISEYIYNCGDKLNNVRTLISRLKSKTSSNLIESIFDEGYKIRIR